MKIEVTFLDLHNPLFTQGSNLGNKINVAQKGARAVLDTNTGLIWFLYKGRPTFIPLMNTGSGDPILSSEQHIEIFGEEAKPALLPPAIARARREAILTDALGFDPNDESPEAHRARVRAASANSNRPNNQLVQTDDLIQTARASAMGMKLPTAQVQNAQQVGEHTGVTGKRKAISHQQMKAQVAQEMKEPTPA